MQLMCLGITSCTMRSNSFLPCASSVGFQLVGLVEMILDRALVAPGDEHHVGDARRHRFFHRILDQRLVHDRQHLLGGGLGGRQEAAAHAGYRKYGFRDFFHFIIPINS